MAEAGESLGGELLFDFQYLRRLAAQLEDSVEKVVLDLNVITDNRYLALAEAFEKVRVRVSEALESRLSLPLIPYVLPLQEIDRDLSGAVGEKMARLGEIRKRLRYKVPEGFVITARACLRLFEEIRLPDRLREVLDEPEDGTSLARRIEARLTRLILEARLPRDVSRSIHKALGGFAEHGKAPGLFAVRSSAIGEDGDLSFAGLHETSLGVTVADVLEHYRRVVASLFTAPAVVYRNEHQEPLEQALMAVGCLRMVPVRSSGVAYTLDPNDPGRDVLLISAAPGLGKMVVEGGGRIDRFVVSRVPPYRVLEREVPPKDQMYQVDPRGGVRRAACRPIAGIFPPSRTFFGRIGRCRPEDRAIHEVRPGRRVGPGRGRHAGDPASAPPAAAGRYGRHRPKRPGRSPAAPRPAGGQRDYRLPGHRLRPRGGGPRQRGTGRSAQGFRAGGPFFLAPPGGTGPPCQAP